MADHRASQFVRIVIRISGSLAAKIDSARGGDSVSQFVRDAIATRLIEKGLHPTNNEILAPDRKGKGGPKPKK